MNQNSHLNLSLCDLDNFVEGKTVGMSNSYIIYSTFLIENFL